MQRVLVGSRKWFWAAMAAALVLLAFVAVLSYQSFAKLGEMRVAVDHTLKVLITVERLSSSLKDAETGQRGYLLTGKAGYLQPFNAAKGAIMSDVEAVRTLTADNAAQQKRIAEASVLIRDKFDEMQRLVNVRDQRGLSEAIAQVNADRGKMLMDRLRALLQQMEDEENGLLAQRNTAVLASSRDIVIFTSGFLGLVIVSIGASFWLLMREVEARRAAEELFRLLTSNVVDFAIIMLNPSGNIVRWNAGAERIKGFSADEVIGKHYTQFYIQADADVGKPRNELEIAKRDGKFEGLGWQLRKDGTRFYANVVITALRDESGALRGFAKITRDITERQQASEALFRSAGELSALNEKLAAARDIAEDASRFKSEFVANMSHEIRTPMNGIIGLCSVLLKSGLNDTQASYAVGIREAGSSLLSVINDILDFSKIEAGRLDLSTGEFDPIRVVESACEIVAAQARAKQLSIMSFVEPAVPPRLRGDSDRLRQVLLNLISNAVKFCDQGEIVVRASLESTAELRCTVKFSVVDKGIGLTEEQQNRLFNPFTQADGSISRKYGGTGLGLSISKRLVELMGGTIGVESIHGVGSNFWFTVPLEVRSEAKAVNIKDELAGVRVLIVDDEAGARQILQNYVGSWGMQNTVATTADEGLQMLRKAASENDPYAVALIDLVMPAKNGIAMADEILKDESLKQTKLILLTAYDSAGAGKQAIELGFKAYITKPVRQSTLMDCLVGVVYDKPIFVDRPAEGKTPRPTSGISQGILIVEDNATNQQVAQLYLEELGLPCHVVSNGDEAVAAVRKRTYDLVLMDCQMPIMDGLQASSVIRKEEAHTGKHVPIVAMTAHAMRGDREKCIAAGMDDYLTKPLDFQELHLCLKKWLPAPSAAIDMDQLELRYGGKGQRLIEMYLTEAPRQIGEIQDAVERKSAIDLQRTAHALKGVSATVCARSIWETCRDIETIADGADWDRITVLTRGLNRQFAALQEFVSINLKQT